MSSRDMKEKTIANILVILILTSMFFGLWEWTDRNVEWVCSRVEGREIQVSGVWTFLLTAAAPCTLLFNVGTEIYAATVEDPDEIDP